MKATIAFLALAVVTVIAVPVARSTTAQGGQKWEYMIHRGKHDATTLNGLGNQGWELVAVETSSTFQGSGGGAGRLFFKRLVP